MNFPNPPFPVYKQHKENKPWFFQKPLTAVTGDITHSWLPEGPPTQLRPSTISSISGTQKRPARLLYKMSPTRLITDLPQAGPNTRTPVHTNIQTPLPAPPKAKDSTSRPGPAGMLQPRRKSLRGAQIGKEPGTNAATDWQWREFYYYPIITLGSVPKWSMLPPWCHFLLSWLETKSGSMGAIHMMSLQFTAAASLSFSLSKTHRKINSSQKWLKNA